MANAYPGYNGAPGHPQMNKFPPSFTPRAHPPHNPNQMQPRQQIYHQPPMYQVNANQIQQIQYHHSLNHAPPQQHMYFQGGARPQTPLQPGQGYPPQGYAYPPVSMQQQQQTQQQQQNIYAYNMPGIPSLYQGGGVRFPGGMMPQQGMQNMQGMPGGGVSMPGGGVSAPAHSQAGMPPAHMVPQHKPNTPFTPQVSMSSGPPPSSTPPQPQSLPHQPPQHPGHPPQHQQQQLPQQPPVPAAALAASQAAMAAASQQQPPAPVLAPAAQKPRSRRGIQIINPDTGKSIFEDSKGASSSETAAAPATTPTTEVSAPVLPVVEAEPKRAVSGVAAQFAAQVAAVADSTKSKPAEPPVEEVKEPAAMEAKSQDKEMLSVNTETKREDSLYEPVSPTPLPDSPIEESKSVASAAADESSAADDGFVEAKGRKKKSAATKKAELNRRGQEKEKKGDLLDVFKEAAPQSDAAAKQATPPIKEPTPPVKEPTPPVKEPTPPVVKEPSPPVKELTPPVKESTPPVKEPTPPVVEPVKPKEPEQVKVVKEHVFKQPTPPPIQVDEIVRPKPKPSPSPAPETPENKPRSNGIDHAAANGGNDTDKDELEEGEITTDGEEDDEEGSKTKLKYKYKEDQWSPMNLEGKKQYDREFLIKLQYDSLSLTKPEHLPNMEIVKDKPVSRQMGRAGGFDFAPHFVKPTISRPGRPGGPRTGSKSKESSGPKPRVINIPSFSQDVKLHKAENAYRAGPKKSKVEGGDVSEEDELEELRKKVRSILNKLTPQKFDKLVSSFKELPINSGPKLELSMALIFEKAVDEPSFSVAYAQMCQTLNKIEVPSVEGQSAVKFRTLLISRVQQEFERDYMKDVDKDGYEAKMKDPNLTADEKKKEKALYEAMEMKARRRSLGNIRFIGELYNLNMLTVKIMHGCVRRLLKTTDDESLECLCRLVTTVGQDFERQTNDLFKTTPKEKQGGLTEIPVYFNEMKKIIANKTTSARVRFLMQDVVDLKNNQWRKRREDAGPKTIQQIHADAKKEQLNQSLMNSAPLPSNSGRDRDRRDDRRGGGRDDARKESRKGPSHSQQPTSDDGWTMPTRAARNTLDKVDTNKLRSMGRNAVDADTIQLGPRRGGFSSWGHGSSGAGGRSSRQEEPAMATGNRFAAFSSAEPSQAAYEGRSSGGYSRRPGAYGGRDSDSRAQLLQDVKAGVHTGGGGRSASTILTRTESGGAPAARSASMMVPPKTAVSALKGSSKLDREEVEKISSSLLKEFLNVCDYGEAYQCVIDKFHAETIHLFVENSYNSVIEEKPLMRSRAGSLLSNLVKKELCSPEAYLQGLGAFLEFSPDLIVDIPKLWEFLAVIVAPAFVEESLSMKHLLSSSQKLGETDPTLTGPYVAAVLKEMFKLNQDKSVQLWKSSGLNLGQFLESSQDVESFIRSNKLEFLNCEASEKSGVFNFDSLRKELEGLVKNDSSRLIEVVKSRVPADQLTEPQLMRVLMPLCVESCLEGLGGPISEIKLKEEEFRSLCEKSLGSLVKGQPAELEALFSLQALVHRLEHPRGILAQLFMSLFDLDVVTTDSFTAWKEDTAPARQEGKGVAAKSCVSFFTYMTETINDEEEDENDED